MKQKLNCVLLIDDNESNNYLHKRVLDKAGVAKKVVTMESSKKALDFLSSQEDGAPPKPELIFLDINMPKMNGWEFLEAYEKLDKAQQGVIVIIMITTSPNPEDQKKAEEMSMVNDFRRKPLTLEILNDIVDQHFSG